MAQTLTTEFFEVMGSMKKQPSDGSEASTCESFDDVFSRQRQDSDFSEASARSSIHISLARGQVLSLGAELLQGFSTTDFQTKLQELLRNRDSTGDVPGRMELALTVQSKVLPKYGIPGTFEGVAMMLDAVSPFMDDYMVQQVRWAIDEKLGMNIPPLEESSLTLNNEMTKETFLPMATELLDGFSTVDFQIQMQELLRNSSSTTDVPGRMELALTVQSKVLPKYGIPGTFEGVAMMLDAVSPFMDDYMVQQMHWAIDEKLGMKVQASSPMPNGEMTKELVLQMAKELLEGFSTADFQQKLQGLLRNRSNSTDVPGRMELALTVQSKVLPNYGFPGTYEGIVMMLDAISPFMDDQTVQQMLGAIDEKLGMLP
mmetsp:Transcript_123895/g.231856  ORF Transcript_123895/g.231856 Transcript_123895/m.231856 type:complete len:372 (-) Transcript_123895:272-1387(-)